MFTNSIKVFFLLLTVLALTAAKNGQGKSKKRANPPGVELSCVLAHNKIRLAEYTVVVYRDDIVTDTLTVIEPSPVYFELEYGHQYAIIHQAKGYQERILMVNTVVDSKTRNLKKVFDYQIEMLLDGEPPNTLYDLPVAVVRYDASLGKFDYSKKYHNQIRK